MRSYLGILSFLSLSLAPSVYAQTRASELAAKYTMTSSSTLPFPTATQANSDAQLTVGTWGKIQFGAENVEFVKDPFLNGSIPTAAPTDNVSGPVLRVKYPQGTFSEKTGGLQFFHSTGPFESMMLSYEVAFDQFFDWVKGGKLPGMRGGGSGCSGGSTSDGETCFSMRTMWRRNGAGEGYAYIPPFNGLCSVSHVNCNEDFGVSIGRGQFGFISGRWNRVTVVVQMNDPNLANGYLEIYYNDLLAVAERNLVYRRKSSIQADTLFFSTFFGGSDPSWAPQSDMHTYFRNIQFWGGSTPSAFTGSAISGSSRSSVNLVLLSWTLFIGLVLSLF